MSDEEIKRHFDLVAERMEKRFDLLAEAVQLLDSKVDRKTDALDRKIDDLTTETRAGFRKLGARIDVSSPNCPIALLHWNRAIPLSKLALRGSKQLSNRHPDRSG